VSINPGSTVLSRRSIISPLDTFEGLEVSNKASCWMSDCVVGAMERILPLVRDISIARSVRNGFFNAPEIGSAVTIRPTNILKLFFVESGELIVWVILQVPISAQQIQETQVRTKTLEMVESK
jgi:hypothetical protein